MSYVLAVLRQAASQMGCDEQSTFVQMLHQAEQSGQEVLAPLSAQVQAERPKGKKGRSSKAVLGGARRR